MAFDFIKQLHQATLEKAWNAKPAREPKDPMPKRRQALADRIDVVLAQLKAGETNPKRGMYQTKDGVDGVRVTLKYGSRPLSIDGRTHWFVDDATKFYTDAKRSALKGDLDSVITAALGGKGGAAKASGGSGRVMSEEHRRKISEATKARHAARKAAQGNS